MKVTELIPDYRKPNGELAQGRRDGLRQLVTVSGSVWRGIKFRCESQGLGQRNCPSYAGTVNGFADFQDFAEWHITQIGYGLGYEVDSDILRPATGPKLYSRATCVLIPNNLNSFLCNASNGKRGEWPRGMYLHKRSGKLQVSSMFEGVNHYIGLFDVADVEQARAAYKRSRDAFGKLWYERLSSGSMAVDPRVTEHMRTWEYICDWREDDKNLL